MIFGYRYIIHLYSKNTVYQSYLICPFSVSEVTELNM